MVKRSRENLKVVDLSGRRVKASGESESFNTTFAREGQYPLPANEQILGILANILVDETLPFYAAALDGTVIHINEYYSKVDASLGDTALSPGAADCVGKYQVPSLKPVIADVLASDTTVRAEEIVNINGRERVFLGRHMPVRNERKEVVAVAGTYEDVTAQIRGIEAANKTQAQFQDFARASSDWFFECDADLRIRSLSERFTAIVGQPASLFIGSKFEQFGRFEENLDGKFESRHAFNARKPFREQLFVVEDPSGTELKFHLSGVPVFKRHDGSFEGYRGVGMDVTARYTQADERRAVHNNLESLLAELTRKNIALDVATEQATTALRAKNEFLAAMSHELRTPLNAIIGFAEAFQQQTFGQLDDAYIEYASDIGSSGHHLLGLINDILDVAVIESGGLSLQFDEVSLEPLIKKAVNMNLEAARIKGLKTDSLFLKSDVSVLVDDRRATQILVNLLSNAVKFTPEGGEIGLEISQLTDKNISLTVWDKGVGISAEHQAKVFEKFHQVTTHIYSRQQEGTGLGLHISRELARKMNGDLTLHSVVGEGSRFTFTMPLATGEHSNDDFI
ncbi:PAS domain-containing sensor histidine kinase [Kordiimonas aquimaris]|uniref:PAS domain-containing sensor histidine kinase n=1 Tax=Kordiimonas aquimaris TaxID=707591 RepID=UPI0021CEABA3|nr:PAS domain-containing sensor histidine kinase [Kordiimonas aquimaris]